MNSSNKFLKGLDLFETFMGSRKTTNLSRNQNANVFDTGIQTNQVNQMINSNKPANLGNTSAKEYNKEDRGWKITYDIGSDSLSDKFDLFPSMQLDSSLKPETKVPAKITHRNIIAELRTTNGRGIDMTKTVSSWLKQNLKGLRSKNKQSFGGYSGRSTTRDSNLLKFIIKEVEKDEKEGGDSEEDGKEGEGSEEDITFKGG